MRALYPHKNFFSNVIRPENSHVSLLCSELVEYGNKIPLQNQVWCCLHQRTFRRVLLLFLLNLRQMRKKILAFTEMWQGRLKVPASLDKVALDAKSIAVHMPQISLQKIQFVWSRGNSSRQKTNHRVWNTLISSQTEIMSCLHIVFVRTKALSEIATNIVLSHGNA